MNVFKSMRERCGMTQEALADKLDIERTTVSKWEIGAALPRADKLIQLSKIFNCSVDELLTKTE